MNAKIEKSLFLFVCMALLIGACGTVVKHDNSQGSMILSDAGQLRTPDEQTGAGGISAEFGNALEVPEKPGQAEEQRSFEDIYEEQERAATGWTESELKALAEMPPRDSDYNPHQMTPGQKEAMEAELQAYRELLKDKSFFMTTDETDGHKYWHGEAFAGMGHLISYAIDDPRKAGGYIRFRGEDWFLTSLSFTDDHEMPSDAILIAQIAFKHLPAVNHVDLLIYHAEPDYMNKELYGAFTITRSDFEAVMNDTSLTDAQRFRQAFREDDFDAR